MRIVPTLVLASCLPLAPLMAQSDGRSAVLAIADSALAAISRNDFAAFADLMLDSAVTVATFSRGGTAQTEVSTPAGWRTYTSSSRWTERGWNPTVHLQQGLAVVWLPYDFHIDGKWAHCGVNTFMLVKRGERWLIASLAFTMEQPPACDRHPAGPPGA